MKYILLRILPNSQVKTCIKVFFNNFACLQSAILLIITPEQTFSRRFNKILENNVFIEHLQATGSAILEIF